MQPQPLYRSVLGAEYERLPVAVRALHDLDGSATWNGRADVLRGTSWIARLAATIGGLPPTGNDQALSVTFTQHGQAEIWHRRFGTKVFRTVQTADPKGGGIWERMGPANLLLAPRIGGGELMLSLSAQRVAGIPIPRWLLPIVTTREYETPDGRYRFAVEASHPWTGRLVRYEGWLLRSDTPVTS